MRKSKTPSPAELPDQVAAAAPYRHPLVRHLRKWFRFKKTDEKGFLVPEDRFHLGLRVGPGNLDRALPTKLS